MKKILYRKVWRTCGRVSAQAEAEIAVGGRGADVFIGGGCSSVFIRAGDGDDLIIGGAANDEVFEARRIA